MHHPTQAPATPLHSASLNTAIEVTNTNHRHRNARSWVRILKVETNVECSTPSGWTRLMADQLMPPANNFVHHRV